MHDIRERTEDRKRADFCRANKVKDLFKGSQYPTLRSKSSICNFLQDI